MNNYTKGEMTLTDWETTAKQMFGNKIAVGKIVERVAKMRPDVPIEQVQADVIEATGVRTNLLRTVSADKPRPIGIIGDLHTPFDHSGYLSFLKDTFQAFNVSRVVFIGDLFDHYCYSRFTKKPLAWNPKQEKEMAKERISKYCEAFPEADVVWGNHDTRPIDHAEEAAIDAEIIKELKEVYNLPKGWKFYDEYENTLIIDNVLYIHGTAYNGQTGAKQAALNEQMSVVMGHGHAFAGLFPLANKRKLMFGMNVGCGIDIAAYAFAYNKKDKFRPLLGCGIVFNPSYATWVPMGKKYFRTAD